MGKPAGLVKEGAHMKKKEPEEFNGTPLRFGRILTVSGSIPKAVSLIVKSFTLQGFRVTSASGEFPVKLEIGQRWANFLTLTLGVSYQFLHLSENGVVIIDKPTANGAASDLLVRLHYADYVQRMSPIVLESIANAAKTLEEEGLLISLGPIIATKGRLL